MKLRAALIGLLSTAAVIVLIVLLSEGDGGTPSTTPQVSGTTGRGATEQNATVPDGSSERSSGDRKRRETRSERGPRRQEQGRLGAQPGGSPAQGERLSRTRPGARVATILVSGGGPVGGVQRVRFPKGRRVRLIVRSDTDEVVEIPGYRLTRRVRAGGSARFYFKTSKVGLFAIELARGQTRIGVLQVG